MTKKLGYVIFVFLLFFSFFGISNAQVISQQTISGVSTADDNVKWFQTIGTGISGTVGSLSFFVDVGAFSNGLDWNFFVGQTTNATGTAGDVIWDSEEGNFTSQQVSAGKILLTAYFISEVPVLNSSKYTYIGFYDRGDGSPSGAQVSMYGSSGDVISGLANGLGEDLVEAQGLGSCDPGDCGTVEDVYYVLRGTGDLFASSTTRVVIQNSPANGSLTSTNDVLFDFDYYFNDIETPNISIAGVQVLDLSTPFEYFPIESDIIASGVGSFTGNLVLNSGDLHMWRGYLRNATSSDFRYGSWYTFDVVTQSASSTQYIDPETGLPIYATSTGFFDFLNVPYLLQTKAPFAYIYQVGALLQDLDSISATATPLFVLPLGMASTTLPGVGDIEFFSADTVTELMPDSFISFMRAIIIAVIYVGLGLLLFRNVGSIFS